eukprot:XP_028351860.1 DNA repair protein RAD51 homolog 2-like isoform X1 [Physeter catodon]
MGPVLTSISGSSCVTAALGNTWSHSVNTRLILQYLGSERRQILIAKSPLATFTTFVYTIEKEGLVLQGRRKREEIWEAGGFILPEELLSAGAAGGNKR